MPKLPENIAKRTAEAETGWSMEESIYVVQLKAVYDADPKTKKAYEGPKGPYWNWVVEFPKSGIAADLNENRYKGRQLWRSVSLSEDADNIRKETYEAFGDPTASIDTDELIGNFALVETYNDEYNGQISAKVKKFMPLDPEQAAKLDQKVVTPAASGGKGKGKAADKPEELY